MNGRLWPMPPIFASRRNPIPKTACANGLVMVDKPVTIRRDRIGQKIGRVADDEIKRVNSALAYVMGLAD